MPPAARAKKLRLYGELLSANLYLAQKGMKSITVPNWYDEGKEVTIPLDLRFTPSQNAQNFFKNYKRSRPPPGCWWTCWQRAKKEIAYLETVLYEVESASGEAAPQRDPGRAEEPGLSEILQAARQAPEACRLPAVHLHRRL